MKPRIKNCIENLKHLPGVYLMYNIDNQIIYIGKAKDLYKRVSQYFLHPQVNKVLKMVNEAEYFETIITNNEKEALVLEMNLIQTHYPKYNILLKDDRHYPYIALSKSGDPILCIKRNKKDNKYTYFGPYPNATSAYKMIDLLNQLFPLRKCKNKPKEVCLYYHLKQCLGNCVNDVSEVINNNLRKEVNKFLSGNNLSKYQEIKNKMLKASDEENFELALEYKKTLDALDHINQKQGVELKEKKSLDVFAFSIRENFFSLSLLLYRKGRLLAKENHILELFLQPSDFFEYLISQYYLNHELPDYIVVSLKESKENLSSLLDTNVICPSRGHIYELIQTAKINADNGLDEFFISPKKNEDKIKLIEELGHILSIDTPYHIELFDNSHLQGSSPVGAMVCFINGESVKGNYRKFNITNDESRSDVDSMKEVIKRHYTRIVNEDKKLPDLILVDGGVTQVRAAKDTLKNITDKINVFGLFKDEKHRTKGIVDYDGKVKEIKNKEIIFLLTRMQDEVHRFAITFHKEKRNKKLTKSYLDGIKGIGAIRKELIKKTFPTLEKLLAASEEELSQIVGSKLAKEILQKNKK